MESNITVSVLIITYNHEKFIEEAIYSVVNQKTSFKFEVLIGNDCSTDKTLELIERVKSKYPDLITVYTSEINILPVANLLNLLKRSRGEYIAILEGDDKWCDKFKLQTQIEFLVDNNHYGACAHKTEYIKSDIPTGQWFPKTNKDFRIANTFNYFQKRTAGVDFHMNSIVFRKSITSEYIEKFNKSKYILDLPLKIAILEHTPVYIINKIMSSYRLNSNDSSFSKLDKMNKKVYEDEMHRLIYTIIANSRTLKKYENVRKVLKIYSLIAKKEYFSSLIFLLKNLSFNLILTFLHSIYLRLVWK
jgi:glycosyltransferase involved in cell wall biosynthesis